jgi:hypothetical protein
MLFITIIGWVGMALILIAYLLITTKQIGPNSTVYQLLNLLGALGVVVNSIFNDAWPSAILFIVWACMAIIYLLSLLRK